MTDESTDFLYPMIDGTEDAGDVEALLDDLASSASGKTATSGRLTTTTLAALDGQLDATAAAMAARFDAGGRLFTCGNGGSATDAEGVASMFSLPSPGARPLAARSLVADVSILTALANDIGFEVVFARQLMAHGREADMVMGFSTSGNSANVIAAFERGAEAGMLTVGLAGYEGGAMAGCDSLQHCLVVRSDSVHRIQEAQSATAHELWRRIQRRLGDRAAA
jgi:D-sedoheptulose 7-phosphate isomerase